MTNKKNAFFRFLFSLIPGAGEMYMGFLKMGVSLMALFMAIIFIGVLGFGPLICLDFIVWFYSFFHVHNLASLSDEEFYAIEDDYLFHYPAGSDSEMAFLKKNNHIFAVVLIFIGAAMSWQGILNLIHQYLPDYIYYIIRNFTYDLPRIIAGIAIIALGILMIRGKKQELEDATYQKQEVKEDGER